MASLRRKDLDVRYTLLPRESGVAARRLGGLDLWTNPGCSGMWFSGVGLRPAPWRRVFKLAVHFFTVCHRFPGSRSNCTYAGSIAAATVTNQYAPLRSR